MRKPFKPSIHHIPLCFSLIAHCLCHPKSIELIAGLLATLGPRPSVYFWQHVAYWRISNISAFVQKLSESLPITTFRQLFSPLYTDCKTRMQRFTASYGLSLGGSYRDTDNTCPAFSSHWAKQVVCFWAVWPIACWTTPAISLLLTFKNSDDPSSSSTVPPAGAPLLASLIFLQSCLSYWS